MSRAKPHVRILGCRGIPGRHGGFETFAERLALYLARRDWRVTVYCQAEEPDGPREDEWNGVRRIHLPVARGGSLGSIEFDIRSTRHAGREPGLVFTLGYNTGVLGAWYRWRGLTHVMNMDGIEWRRSKWSPPVRAWFYLNERLSCLLADHLVADHPAIASHLATRVDSDKITMVPYGADSVEQADPDLLRPYDLQPRGYVLVVARPEPENSLREIVAAYSEKRRGTRLVIVGDCRPEEHRYHRHVADAAGDEVRFVGAVYDARRLAALRYHAALYVHGHQVGGTNPSLVESMGAGSAVLAQDNRFNRWVAGDGGLYFSGQSECASRFDSLLDDSSGLDRLRRASRDRFLERFTWERVLNEYESLLEGLIGGAGCVRSTG